MPSPCFTDRVRIRPKLHPRGAVAVPPSRLGGRLALSAAHSAGCRISRLSKSSSLPTASEYRPSCRLGEEAGAGASRWTLTLPDRDSTPATATGPPDLLTCSAGPGRLVTNTRGSSLQQMGAAPQEPETLNSGAQDSSSQLKFPPAPGRSRGQELGPQAETVGPGTAGHAGASQESWTCSLGSRGAPGTGPRGQCQAEQVSKTKGTCSAPRLLPQPHTHTQPRSVTGTPSSGASPSQRGSHTDTRWANLRPRPSALCPGQPHVQAVRAMSAQVQVTRVRQSQERNTSSCHLKVHCSSTRPVPTAGPTPPPAEQDRGPDPAACPSPEAPRWLWRPVTPGYTALSSTTLSPPGPSPTTEDTGRAGCQGPAGLVCPH